MVEARTGADQSIKVSDRDAYGCGLSSFKHPAPYGAMQEEPVTLTPIKGRDDDGPSFEDKPHMTNQAAVENSIDRLAVIVAANGKSLQSSFVRSRKRIVGLARQSQQSKLPTTAAPADRRE